MTPDDPAPIRAEHRSASQAERLGQKPKRFPKSVRLEILPAPKPDHADARIAAERVQTSDQSSPVLDLPGVLPHPNLDDEQRPGVGLDHERRESHDVTVADHDDQRSGRVMSLIELPRQPADAVRVQANGMSRQPKRLGTHLAGQLPRRNDSN